MVYDTFKIKDIALKQSKQPPSPIYHSFYLILELNIGVNHDVDMMKTHSPMRFQILPPDEIPSFSLYMKKTTFRTNIER